MKAVRLTRNLIVAIALAVSLGTNAMLFVGGVLYSFVDKFVEEAFDLATAAGKQRKAMTALKTGSAKQARALAASRAVVARQRGELSTWRSAAARQSREIAALKALAAKQRRQIVALKATAAKQGRALSDMTTASLRQGRAHGKLRLTAASVAKRVQGRLVRSVARSVVTAPGKALPYTGALVVAGLTVWEIKDLCETVQDMDEIQRAAGVSKAETDTELALCSVRLPSPDRLLDQIERSARKAWEGRKKYIPDLPGWEDIPSSWRDDWRSTVPDILQGIGNDLRRLAR